MDAAEKAAMRDLVLRGGPCSDAERSAILDYCQEDVDALARLLPAMADDLDLPRALLRGRYMAAAARIEWDGVPIDVETLARLRAGWDGIKGDLIAEVDRDYGVFDGHDLQGGPVEGLARPRGHRLADASSRGPSPWTTTPSARWPAPTPRVGADARAPPRPVARCGSTDLAVGRDGRNRYLLSAFGSKTGRNQPSNTRFIFGPSAWLRGLIKPGEGRAVAYVDWSPAGVRHRRGALGRPGDDARRIARATPTWPSASRPGRIPAGGTKATHGAERELFKACVLGVQYGMGEVSLARRIGRPPVVARELLRLHRETYPAFWRWSDAAEAHAMLRGSLHTVFGWTVRVGADANPRSLRNFPCQANGAEMLRLACCLATERGIRVCAPVHDALLIEGPAGAIHEVADETRRRCGRRRRSSWTGSRCGPTSRRSSPGPIATWTSAAGGCGTGSCVCWIGPAEGTWRRRQEVPGAGATPAQSYFLYLFLLSS